DDEHIVRVTLRELLRRIPGDHAAPKDDVLRAASWHRHRLLTQCPQLSRRPECPRRSTPMSRHEICGVARFAALLQAMANGVRSGVGFPAGADLCVYIRDMARDRAHAQREVIRYLAIRAARGDEPQHLR